MVFDKATMQYFLLRLLVDATTFQPQDLLPQKQITVGLKKER